jgi:drug/metabolite transporter (DMT)-like permease
VAYLALSGLIGLSLGDLALFTAYVRVGPRLASLVMTTAPIFATLIGWLALGETLQGWAWLGMALTVGGVAWVVRERPANGEIANRHRGSGLLLAFVAAACQAAGLLLSKAGIGHGWLPVAQHLKPQTATLLRMFFAGVFVLPTLLWLARTTNAAPAMAITPRTRRAGYVFTLLGSIFGPFLGVWMSLEAADRAPLGVAQTLCSLPPVFILPFVWMAGEHVSLRAVLGAVVAVAGIALLFLFAAHT